MIGNRRTPTHAQGEHTNTSWKDRSQDLNPQPSYGFSFLHPDSWLYSEKSLDFVRNLLTNYVWLLETIMWKENEMRKMGKMPVFKHTHTHTMHVAVNIWSWSQLEVKLQCWRCTKQTATDRSDHRGVAPSLAPSQPSASQIDHNDIEKQHERMQPVQEQSRTKASRKADNTSTISHA